MATFAEPITKPCGSGRVGTIVRHGTTTGYRQGCRCVECNAARRLYEHSPVERDKRRARSLARVKRNYAKRSRLIRRWKLLKGCARCGYRKDVRALEIHHRDEPRKQGSTFASLLGSRSMDFIKCHLSKCEVLCANCHSIETLKDAYGDD